MSKWAGKYVIGLTGNIGTGKSVVRRMLEHLGAYGIDADALGHRAIAKGAPGYAPVLAAFGKFILGPGDQIERAKLARIVFNDPEALHTLEKIVHPLVAQAVDILIRRATQQVIIIEAIKLLEANLHSACDAVWVTYAPPEIQMARLIQNRHMSEMEARQRITSQSSQEQKMAQAHVIIKNTGPFEDTWKQVNAAWAKIQSPGEVPFIQAPPRQTQPHGEVTIARAKPKHSAQIAQFYNRITSKSKLTTDDIMALFGERAFLILSMGTSIMGLVGWQVENLISRTTDMLLDPGVPINQALPLLITEMERASRDLQCEASLVFVPPELAKLEALWSSLGYEQRTPNTLGILAWQEAAQESMPADSTLFFKQLRQDRILRPI